MQSEVDGVAERCSTSRSFPLQDVLDLTRIVHTIGEHSGIRGNGGQEEVVFRIGKLQKGANRGLLLVQYAPGASTDIQNDSNGRRRVLRVECHDGLRPAVIQHGETLRTQSLNVGSPAIRHGDGNQDEIRVRAELRLGKNLQSLCVGWRSEEHTSELQS